MKPGCSRFSAFLNKIVLRLLLLLFVANLFACSAPVIIAPPAERPAIEALLAQLEMDVAEFRSLKGLAKITYLNNGERKAANHVVIAESPEQLRLETLSPFGAPLMLAATDGRHLSLIHI